MQQITKWWLKELRKELSRLMLPKRESIVNYGSEDGAKEAKREIAEQTSARGDQGEVAWYSLIIR